MKVISFNLSTLSTRINAPIDKSNLTNVKQSINWKEIFGENFNSNLLCQVKTNLVLSQSNLLSAITNTGTIRAYFSLN